MPYATVTAEGAAFLENHSGQTFMLGFDMTADQLANMSMVDFARAYAALGENSNMPLGPIYVGLVAAIAVFALLMVLCFAKRHPIGALVFDMLAFGVFSLQNADYASRGVVPSANYDWGIAYYVLFAVLAVAALAAIWLCVGKTGVEEGR